MTKLQIARFYDTGEVILTSALSGVLNPILFQVRTYAAF